MIRKLIIGTGVVAAGASVFVLSKKSPKKTEEDFVFFPPTSTNERISEGLRTGDLLIFQRGMPQEFSSRSVLSFLSRAASNSPWDHLAVVVRDHDPKNDVPYILEAGMNGVQFIPFDERILRSKSNVIALRRLGASQDLSRDLIAMELAQQAFKEQRYRLSWGSLIWAALFPAKRQAEVKNCSRLLALDSEIESLQQQISELDKLSSSSSSSSSPAPTSTSTSPAPSSPSNSPSELERRRQLSAHLLQKRLSEQASLRQSVGQAQSKPPSTLLPRFTDIQLVVWFYQQLGLLPLFPHAEQYTYLDFVHQEGGKVPLTPPVALSPEVYIKA